jgi:hypothetical protein
MIRIFPSDAHAPVNADIGAFMPRIITESGFLEMLARVALETKYRSTSKI